MSGDLLGSLLAGGPSWESRPSQATPAAPPPPPPEPDWASSILEGLSMSWDSDVAAEAVSEAAPAVDDASSDDEGDAPPGPPRSRRELECRSEAASSDRSVFSREFRLKL